MTETEATAEVFWTAFQVLDQDEQQAFLRRIIKDVELRHDLMDLALIEERSEESARPLREYLEEAGE